jgi:hypothetical protein
MVTLVMASANHMGCEIGDLSIDWVIRDWAIGSFNEPMAHRSDVPIDDHIIDFKS